ncbi:protein ANTAGONIST OF LIKE HETEROCHROMATIN PROTEIN 1-like [Cicer arietinum]|uniref:Protein ANTAGONIST OF LIKE HETEROCHROMATIN PROTEIN 1-like n=1 Tax=Cicer arietinum TaxID=3827 RepID=A0A1S3E695_CICAR|nr:protein ANTAGONIST OF LIKE HETEROCHROMATIN PROTEIN 1-like [Cicer arietinum]
MLLLVVTRFDVDTSDDSTSDESDDDFVEFLISNVIYDYHHKFFNKGKVLTSSLSGREFVAEVLNGSETSCFDLFRMKKECFLNFCNELRGKNYLSDSRDVLVEEKVATFLFIIGHNVRHRVASNRFQHSTETISRNFKEVLRAVCRLGKELIKQESIELPERIKNNSKYYPWFKNCIGAIDGTHISAWVPAEKQISCRGRKTTITQNVMCACDFNMMFTYVYSGWEGSAHDSKVFLDAISNPNAGFPWPPRGSFYLVDSGYPCTRGLLPPYRGERYHAQEYRGQGRQPRSPEELFNYRHSSLRMTIERCFGVLKNRFPILKLMPPYKPSRQRLIVIACCTIHNYIRKWNLPDELFNIWEAMDPMELERVNESSGIEGTSSNDNLTRLSDEGAVEMTMSRNRIRDRMWVHHHN